MPASVAVPAVRQKGSELAPTCCCQASSTIAVEKPPAGVVDLALFSFAHSVPRAYRLKAGNVHLIFSTSTGDIPSPPCFFVRGLVGIEGGVVSG
jgi:hypothetical protein